jgi:hypothetical protein
MQGEDGELRGIIPRSVKKNNRSLKLNPQWNRTTGSSTQRQATQKKKKKNLPRPDKGFFT